MSNDNKIHELPKMDKDELKASIEQLKRSMDTWIEWGETIAKMRRAHYDAYIAQGFAPEQALILCQNMTL